MQLFLSLSKCSTTTRRILDKRDKYFHDLKLGNILLNPLIMRRDILNLLKEYCSEIKDIMVDSGAFLVQQGRLDYSQLLCRIEKVYSELPCASWYVLPDYIPLSQDDDSTVERKVELTVGNALRLADKLGDSVRHKLIPVVHGRTMAHFHKCINAYARMKVKRIAFGSLVTNGPSNGINSLSRRTIDTLADILTLANKHALEVHLFGISGPTHLLICRLFGVSSVDSSAWNRIAGYGLIYLPFLRSFHITAGARHSKSYSMSQIERMLSVAAPDFSLLPQHALKTCMYSRSLHNWKCLHYMTECVSSIKPSLREAIARFSPRNSKLLEYAEDYINHVLIRKAQIGDKNAINEITRSHYKELGYVRAGEIEHAIKRGNLVVAELLGKIIGFQEYRHLKTQPLTRLYHKAVIPKYRRRGIGRKLVQFVMNEAKSIGMKELSLKCVEDLPANIFHKRCGFRLTGKLSGKRRSLNVYSLGINESP